MLSPQERELGQAYNAHHAHCRACIAAGRGANYATRCSEGLKLWSAYQSAGVQPRAPVLRQYQRR